MRKLIPCLLILLMLLSGCGDTSVPTQVPEPPAATPVINESPSAPTESPEPPESEYPTLANATELSDYLNRQVEQGVLNTSFIYSGNSTRINEQTLIEILAALHVDIQRDSTNRKLFHVSVTGFPGDRIAAAHQSGDTSSLSPDELQVLETARQMVAEAQAAADSPLELERALHDMLLERVDYYEYDVKTHDPANVPRHITVIGALLDGTANSQGYADAFYTLASIAGFQVDRMCVLKNYDEPYMINLIHLDEAWYTVDAAHNDSEDAHPAFLLFNTGRNLKLVYDWGDDLEYHPIASVRYEYTQHYSGEIPKVASLTELRQYYNELVAQDIFDIVFEYTGDTADFDELGAYQIADSNAAVLFTYPDQPTLYCLSIMEHPGYRIVDAYFSGDTSMLSNDELLTLNEAIGMVEEAKAAAGSELELELLLHDMIIERVSYDTSFGTTILDVRTPLRHLTAVGALLDGIANCQGYTDAFYVLASIAGFEVDKMVVGAYDPGDHITNVIKLDGAWYIVDTTFDDGDGVFPYFMFNVGTDLAASSYSWGEEAVDHPLAAVSDEHYYYYMPGNAIDAFDSQVSAAEHILDQWRSTGQSEFLVLLKNQNATADAFNQQIYNAATRKNLSASWATWTYPHGTDTVFRVQFQGKYRP